MILNEILSATKASLVKRKKRIPLPSLVQKIGRKTRDFYGEVSKRDIKPNIIAEIKHATPSRGKFPSNLSIEQRIKKYQQGGATAISLVTEPHFFHGSLEMIKFVKKISTLPVLQKDFIIDEYQLYEARLLGADALLLIAKILSQEKLNVFVNLCFKLGIEPIVEVASRQELKRAILTKARCIAVNARDLESMKLKPNGKKPPVFNNSCSCKTNPSKRGYLPGGRSRRSSGTSVDISAACRLGRHIPKQQIFLGFSGINCRDDFDRYSKAGAKAVLIGTALMKSNQPELFLKSLKRPLVKICGIQREKELHLAQAAGADLIGFLFVPNKKRTITYSLLANMLKKISLKAKTVGVFANAQIRQVLNYAKELKLDFVQLHGKESPQYVKKVKKHVSVIKAFRVTKKQLINGWRDNISDYEADYLMLDRKNRRHVSLPLDQLKILGQKFPIIIAGGLNPSNVAEAVKACKPAGVDVSSGVERKKKKDFHLMKKFVKMTNTKTF